MRRTLIILAFLYFSIDSIFFLIKSGWPFTLPQWILVFMVIGIVAFAVYQWKLLIKEEKEKKEELKAEEERLRQLQAEKEQAEDETEPVEEETESVEEEETASAESKYDE